MFLCHENFVFSCFLYSFFMGLSKILVMLEFSTQLLYFPNTDFVFSKYDQRILCVKMVGTTVTVEPILQMNVQFCRNEIVAELFRSFGKTGRS